MSIFLRDPKRNDFFFLTFQNLSPSIKVEENCCFSGRNDENLNGSIRKKKIDQESEGRKSFSPTEVRQLRLLRNQKQNNPVLRFSVGKQSDLLFVVCFRRSKCYCDWTLRQEKTEKKKEKDKKKEQS